MWYNCFSWGGFPLFPLLIISIIAFLVYSIFSNKRETIIVKKSNLALESLNNRYAKGEISKDEYKTIKNDLL